MLEVMTRSLTVLMIAAVPVIVFWFAFRARQPGSSPMRKGIAALVEVLKGMTGRDVVKYFWPVPLPLVATIYFQFDSVRPERPGGDLTLLLCGTLSILALSLGWTDYKKSILDTDENNTKD